MKTRQDNISLLLAGKGQSALCGLTFFHVMEVLIWTVLKCYCRWIHLYRETLYKALCSLPEKQRKVLLFDFWGALPDGEIAARMEVTTRTVYNLRQRAFKTIKTFYEQGSSEP